MSSSPELHEGLISIFIPSVVLCMLTVRTVIFDIVFREIAAMRFKHYMDRVKRIWYLSPMRAAKVQASLRIHAVSPEPSLLAHTSSESRGTFRQKARSLAPLNGWACVVKICHDGMLEDTNSLDGAHMCHAIRMSGDTKYTVIMISKLNIKVSGSFCWWVYCLIINYIFSKLFDAFHFFIILPKSFKTWT